MVDHDTAAKSDQFSFFVFDLETCTLVQDSFNRFNWVDRKSKLETNRCTFGFWFGPLFILAKC
jgi:hypothetical protein